MPGLNINTRYWTINPAKNQAVSDESCFTTDTTVWRELKKSFASYQRLKNQKHSVNISLSCCSFHFYEHFNKQFTYAVFYIQNRKMY